MAPKVFHSAGSACAVVEDHPTGRSHSGHIHADAPPPFNLKEIGPTDRSWSSGGGRSEPLRDQREAVLFRRIAQFFVPAGKLELFAGGEGEGACEVNGVVSAQRMSACALSSFR